MKNFIAWFFSPIKTRWLAWFLIWHGLANVTLTWVLVSLGLYIAALVTITWGNVVIWGGYYELERRKNGR